MRILVITSEPYPFGGAATNRFKGYSQELVKLGNELSVIIWDSRGLLVEGNNKSGIHQGIRYEYGFTPASHQKVIRKFYKLIQIIPSIVHTRMFLRRHEVDCIILISNGSMMMLMGFILSKIHKVKYIQEKSEYPFIAMRASSKLQRLYAEIYVKSIYKLFDGFIVMTYALQEYFFKVSKKGAMIHHMPMTVDLDRFNDISVDKEKWITYIGTFGGDKDGVHILIEAFSQTNKCHSEWKLVLMGAPSKDEKQQLIDLASARGVSENIWFAGKISYDEVPAYLCRSSILVLARPATMQAHYGFPSKLGEYLASGNPVVLTDVGEIKRYLQDGVSAMIAAPNNAESISSKIKALIDNPARAQQIGSAGRKVAEEYFNIKTQSIELAKYLESLRKSK